MGDPEALRTAERNADEPGRERESFNPLVDRPTNAAPHRSVHRPREQRRSHLRPRRPAALSARWRADGHDLGLGIGVALGYATLGVVGGAERRDYTALGSVVNLAARLCSEAGDGEVLVDQRAAAGQDVPLRGPVRLKGFGEVAVHALP